MSNPKEDYFDYVINTLGVKSIYIESSPADINTQASIEIPLLIKVENLDNFTVEESDLLEKMVAALKMDLNQIKIIDSRAGREINAGYTVFLVDENSNPAASTSNSVVTHSPRVLIKNASL
ncbi:MAG: hypothetical protein ACXVAX_03505, partial [Pseudobdellovibrio sp.]